MGDFISPKKQQVFDRIKERLERCRKQQALCLAQFNSTREERTSHDRQEIEILHKRYNDSRSKRPKGPKQDGGQAKAKNEGCPVGSGGLEAPGARQQTTHKQTERKRPHPESANGQDPCIMGEAQSNGFEETANKRPCTEISVQIVQKTGEQTDLTVTTTIQQSNDSISEASNNNQKMENGCMVADCPPVSQSNGQHQEWTEKRRQTLERLLDEPDSLEEFMKQLEKDPEQMKGFEAELEKICNKLQQDLGDGTCTFPDGTNLESQPTQEMSAVPSLADAAKLGTTTKQRAPMMPVAPMIRGSTLPSVAISSYVPLKQHVKTEIIPGMKESSEVYDPMMKGPPNTVATDAHSAKEGPLPAIAEFKNPAIFDGTHIKIEPQAGNTVDGQNSLPVQFQQNQGQANLLNQKQLQVSTNQKTLTQLQSPYLNTQQQLVGATSGKQLGHYANPQQALQQQQLLQQQQQQQHQGGISSTGTQFGMQMSRSLQSLQDQLKQRSNALTGAFGGVQNPSNPGVARTQFGNRQNQMTGRLPSMAQIFGPNRLNAQQVQQQQQQQQQSAAFTVDGGIQQVHQTITGTQQSQLPQQQQQPQQQAQFVQQRQQLPLTSHQLLRQQMIQRHLLRQQQQNQLVKLTPDQRRILIARHRQLKAQQLQKELQRGPPPRYDETQHRNSTFTNSAGLMQQTGNVPNLQITGTCNVGNNALMTGNVRQVAPVQPALQQGNLHHQGMRTNQTVIGSTGTQLSQGMFPNQAQAQFIQQRRLLQSLAGNNLQMNNQAGQPAGAMLNQLERSRVQNANTANLGHSGVYIKPQMRGQNPAQMASQGTNVLSVNPVGQSIQVSTVARFPNNLVNTTSNVRTFMQNTGMPSQNLNIHPSMTSQSLLQQHGYRNQPSSAVSSAMQPTNHSQPSIVTTMSSPAATGTPSSNQMSIDLPVLDPNVNLGTNTMSNVEFDLELLENILKTKE